MTHQALTTYRALLDAAAAAHYAGHTEWAERPNVKGYERNPKWDYRPCEDGSPAFVIVPTGDRSTMRLANCRERLQAMAEQVRKHWALYGGGPKPDELKPKPRKASEWSARLVRCWLGQIEDKDHAGAMLTAEQLGGWYALVGNTPDSHARGFVAPQQVEGLPERIVSACRDDGRWVVMDRVSAVTLCNQKARSRASAEADAFAQMQQVAQRRGITPEALLSDALARVQPAADGLDQWRKRWDLVDVAPVSEVAQPVPEPAELVQAPEPAELVHQAPEPAPGYPGDALPPALLAKIATHRSGSMKQEAPYKRAGYIRDARDGWTDLTPTGREYLQANGYSWQTKIGWAKQTPEPAPEVHQAEPVQVADQAPEPGSVNPAGSPVPEVLTGAHVRRLMRAHGATIERVAVSLQTTRARVRLVRERGLSGLPMVLDWLQGITGRAPALAGGIWWHDQVRRPGLPRPEPAELVTAAPGGPPGASDPPMASPATDYPIIPHGFSVALTQRFRPIQARPMRTRRAEIRTRRAPMRTKWQPLQAVQARARLPCPGPAGRPGGRAGGLAPRGQAPPPGVAASAAPSPGCRGQCGPSATLTRFLHPAIQEFTR